MFCFQYFFEIRIKDISFNFLMLIAIFPKRFERCRLHPCIKPLHRYLLRSIYVIRTTFAMICFVSLSKLLTFSDNNNKALGNRNFGTVHFFSFFFWIIYIVWYHLSFLLDYIQFDVHYLKNKYCLMSWSTIRLFDNYHILINHLFCFLYINWSQNKDTS